MALQKKGSRTIVVDGVTYRWRLRKRPTYCQGNGWTPCTYAVELAESPACTLAVTTAHAHPGNWLSKAWKPVLPSDVASSIRIALVHGWTPSTPGSPFTLDLSRQSHLAPEPESRPRHPG